MGILGFIRFLIIVEYEIIIIVSEILFPFEMMNVTVIDHGNVDGLLTEFTNFGRFFGNIGDFF